MKKSLPEWLSWLEQQHPKEIDLGLERVGQVADCLGLRDLGCPVITVGGTNGKGSTVATLVSIYRAAGLDVGCYTSPHLLHFNERIALNDTPVDDKRLLAAFEKIHAAQGDISLTYFEFTTLAAFLIFKEAGLDVVVLEVGLGGRLDAVNLVSATVAVVTSIGIDHVEYLGNTRAAIALEKAGIFRQGQIAVSGDTDPPPELQMAADKVGATLLQSGRDFSFQEMGDSWHWQQGIHMLKNLPKPHLALENVATALTALFAVPIPVSEAAIREGLAKAALPGRMQVIAESPQILLDVAHNPHGIAFLKRHLPVAKPGQKTLAVFAMMRDKDIAGAIEGCLGYFDAWFVGGLPVARAASSQQLQSLLLAHGCHVAGRFDSVAKALSAARQQAGAHDRIIVFGSFYTVAAAQRAMLRS